MNNPVVGKTMVNVTKHRDIKLVTTKKKKVFGNFFIENLLPVEMRKMQIFLNKPVYLAWSMLDLSKILMYEFWYDYAEAKCGEKAKLCCLDTDSFIAYVKTNDIYIYI